MVVRALLLKTSRASGRLTEAIEAMTHTFATEATEFADNLHAHLMSILGECQVDERRMQAEVEAANERARREAERRCRSEERARQLATELARARTGTEDDADDVAQVSMPRLPAISSSFRRRFMDHAHSPSGRTAAPRRPVAHAAPRVLPPHCAGERGTRVDLAAHGRIGKGRRREARGGPNLPGTARGAGPSAILPDGQHSPPVPQTSPPPAFDPPCISLLPGHSTLRLLLSPSPALGQFLG